MPNPTVYIASKLRHAEMLRQLYRDNPDINFTSRWIWNAGQLEDSPTHAKNFWQHNLWDIQHASTIILYLEPEDRGRGCFIEVGAGIESSWIITVGDHEDYGTWQYYDSVASARTLQEALQMVRDRTRF